VGGERLGSKPYRFGVLDRYASDAESIVWIETDACFNYHVMNAWDDPTNPDRVRPPTSPHLHLRLMPPPAAETAPASPAAPHAGCAWSRTSPNTRQEQSSAFLCFEFASLLLTWLVAKRFPHGLKLY
jgi:hypothetical protein